MPSAQPAAISEYYRQNTATATLDPPLPLPELSDRDKHWGDLTAEPDSRRFAARATRAGVPVKSDVFADQQHTFQMMAGRAPEADEAIAGLAAWLRPHLGLD